jgi:hypothetical protein
MLPCNPFREGNRLVKRTLLLVPIAAGLLASQVWAQSPEIIVESYTDGQNAAAFKKMEGNWFESVAKSRAPGLKATKALFKTASSDPGGARFSPEIPADGKFDVYVTYPDSGNAAGVVYKVKTATGEKEIVLDQDGRDDTVSAPANQWVPLGTFEFKKGTDGFVEIRDPGTGTAANSREPNARVYADAVKFVPNTTGKELSAPAPKAPAPAAGAIAAAPPLSTAGQPPLSAANQPPLSAAGKSAAGSQPPLSAASGAKTAAMPALAAAMPKDSGQPGLAAASGSPALPPLNVAAPSTSVLPGLAAAVPTASSALASLATAAGSAPESGAPPLPSLGAAAPAQPQAPGAAALPGLATAAPPAGAPPLPPLGAAASSSPKASEAPAMPALPGLTAASAPAPEIPSLAAATSASPGAAPPAGAPPLPPLGAAGSTPKALGTPAPPALPGLTAAASPAAPGISSLAAAASASAGAGSPPPGIPGLPPLAGMPPPSGAPGLPPLAPPASGPSSFPPMSSPPSDLAPPVTASTGDASGIQWTYDIGAAQAIAEKSGKKIFVFFVAKGNRTSAKYEKDYLAAPSVKAELDKYVPLRMDFPMNTKYAYKLGVFGAGSLVVMDRAEAVLMSIPFTEVPATPEDLARKLAEIK